MKFQEFKEMVSKIGSDSIIEVIEEICEDVGEIELYDHMELVANLATEISAHYRLNEEEAYLTGFLHDVGRLIDPEEYLDILRFYDVPVTEEEAQVIDVLHGKVSDVISKEVFQVTSSDVSNGILYHTTLRRKATDFEKVMFIADKMTWTYDDLTYSIEETVMQNLNVACYNALKWLIEHIKEKDGLVLDDTKEAYLYFKGSVLL